MLTALEPSISTPESAALRGRPMFLIRGLVSLLDRYDDQVLTLIEAGELLWCFNVSLEPDGPRRELRVLPQCVDDFLAGRPCALDWTGVAQAVLPHDRPFLSLREIERSLNASQAHVTGLMRRNYFKQVTKARHGPNGAALVTPSSFLEFLKARRF